MRFTGFLLGFLLSLACADAATIDSLVARADLWNLTAEEFEKEFIPKYREEVAVKPFRWVSEAHDSARAAEKKLTLFGLPLVEAIARFQEGKLAQVTAALYARGDMGDLAKEKFETLLKESIEALNKTTQAKLTVRGKDASNAVRPEGLIWQTPAAHYLLEYSFVKEVKTRGVAFRAEFVKLEVTPPPRTASLLSTVSGAAKGKFVGATHVKRDTASGDVMITDVPMVDQGEKGYCAVACSERVMRYYGIPVDANEVAQIANSSGTGGTNPDMMLAALKKVGSRLRVRVRQVEDMDIKQILDLITDYNRAAKKAGKKQIVDPGQMINVSEVYASMDLEVLRGVRTKSKAAVAGFQKDVQSHIDTGIPLLWSVMLGVVPEKGIPQGAGGHMRLIIGYNLKTQEVIFTDSWGAGHERKRMPLADAWTITTGVATIEPL